MFLRENEALFVGAWGYVILLCGFLVQVLAMGLQQSLAILIFSMSDNRKYQVVDNGNIGKKSWFISKLL